MGGSSDQQEVLWQTHRHHRNLEGRIRLYERLVLTPHNPVRFFVLFCGAGVEDGGRLLTGC